MKFPRANDEQARTNFLRWKAQHTKRIMDAEYQQKSNALELAYQAAERGEKYSK